MIHHRALTQGDISNLFQYGKNNLLTKKQQQKYLQASEYWNPYGLTPEPIYSAMISDERLTGNEKLRELMKSYMELVPLEDTINIILDSKAGYEST